MSYIALPYPVLGRSDDYVDVDFQATIKINESEIKGEEELIMPFVFDMSDEAISDLIANGKAKYGFEISCSGTSIRYVEFVEEVGTLNLNPKKFFKKVILSPKVFVVDNIKGFSSPNFNPEFGNTTYDLEPGDFLAATDDDMIDVDFRYLRFEDAITVRRQNIDPWVYEFGLDGEAIIIGMGQKYYDFWREAKLNKDLRPYLMATVYKDCLVAALEQISLEISEGNFAWERGLANLLDEKKINIPENASFNDLNSIAQILIENDGIKKVDLS